MHAHLLWGESACPVRVAMHVLLHLQSWRAFFIGALPLPLVLAALSAPFGLPIASQKPEPPPPSLSLWFSGLCHRLYGSAIATERPEPPCRFISLWFWRLCLRPSACQSPAKDQNLRLPPSATGSGRLRFHWRRSIPVPLAAVGSSLWFSGLCHRLHGSAIATESPEPPCRFIRHWRRSISVPPAAVGSGSTGGAPFRFHWRQSASVPAKGQAHEAVIKDEGRWQRIVSRVQDCAPGKGERASRRTKNTRK